MSSETLPQHPPLHSHASAAIGARLNINPCAGTEHAKLLWLGIISHTRWPGNSKRPAWGTNETLARETGLDRRRVQQALAVLRKAEMVTTPVGFRPNAARPIGRVLIPALGSQCKVVIPSRVDMANLWGLCRERRKRPAPMVTMMVGAYALASDHADRHGFAWKTPSDTEDTMAQWTPLGCSQADWRRFVGARKNAAWTARVRECESLGLIRRAGRVVEVAPTRSWLRADRAMAETERIMEQEADERSVRPAHPVDTDRRALTLVADVARATGDPRDEFAIDASITWSAPETIAASVTARAAEFTNWAHRAQVVDAFEIIQTFVGGTRGTCHTLAPQ